MTSSYQESISWSYFDWTPIENTEREQKNQSPYHYRPVNGSVFLFDWLLLLVKKKGEKKCFQKLWGKEEPAAEGNKHTKNGFATVAPRRDVSIPKINNKHKSNYPTQPNTHYSASLLVVSSWLFTWLSLSKVVNLIRYKLIKGCERHLKFSLE